MEGVTTSVEQPVYMNYEPPLFAFDDYPSQSDSEDERDEASDHIGVQDFYRNDHLDCTNAIINAPPPSPQEPTLIDQHFGQKLASQLHRTKEEAMKSHASRLDTLLRRAISCSRATMNRGAAGPRRAMSMVTRRTCPSSIVKRRNSRIPLSSRRIHTRAAAFKAANDLAEAISLVQLSNGSDSTASEHKLPVRLPELVKADDPNHYGNEIQLTHTSIRELHGNPLDTTDIILDDDI